MAGTDAPGVSGLAVNRRCWRSSRGQASVELVAVMPFVLLVGLVLWQLVLAGHTAWLCANAARVAARAAAVGGDGERAARSALPEGLERGLRVEENGSGDVHVRVRVPLLTHRWETPISVGARAHLEPGA